LGKGSAAWVRELRAESEGRVAAGDVTPRRGWRAKSGRAKPGQSKSGRARPR